jgi:hypothetical protein
MPTKVAASGKKCKPFLLRVMVFSPETGYKFTIEIQKSCTSGDEEVWKLLFDLAKKINGSFIDIVTVEFVSGDPNDIQKIAAITDEGIKRPQVRAFRDNVFPLVKPFADSAKTPTPEEQKKIDEAMKKALNAQ